MSLALPDDDDCGPVISSPPQSKGRKASRPRGRSRSSSKVQRSSASSRGVSAGGLPSDDEGPDASIWQTGIPLGDTTSDYVAQYDDKSLKLAAQRIPSQIQHPFDDLRKSMANLQPVSDPDLVDTVWEVFSLPRLQETVISMGGSCRRSYDIRHFWDLGAHKLQRTIFQDICALQPLALFLSPPCRFVCALQHSNWGRMKTSKRVISLKEACELIDFAMWLAEHQELSGKIFGFEHPWLSLAWGRDSVA